MVKITNATTSDDTVITTVLYAPVVVGPLHPSGNFTLTVLDGEEAAASTPTPAASAASLMSETERSSAAGVGPPAVLVDVAVELPSSSWGKPCVDRKKVR